MATRFRGSSAVQDSRFTDKTERDLSNAQFPTILDSVVDMREVDMERVRTWVHKRLREALGLDDEVLKDFVCEMLEEARFPDPKKMWVVLAAFLEEETSTFMTALWDLLIALGQMKDKAKSQGGKQTERRDSLEGNQHEKRPERYGYTEEKSTPIINDHHNVRTGSRALNGITQASSANSTAARDTHRSVAESLHHHTGIGGSSIDVQRYAAHSLPRDEEVSHGRTSRRRSREDYEKSDRRARRRSRSRSLECGTEKRRRRDTRGDRDNDQMYHFHKYEEGEDSRAIRTSEWREYERGKDYRRRSREYHYQDDTDDRSRGPRQEDTRARSRDGRDATEYWNEPGCRTSPEKMDKVLTHSDRHRHRHDYRDGGRSNRARSDRERDAQHGDHYSRSSRRHYRARSRSWERDRRRHRSPGREEGRREQIRSRDRHRYDDHDEPYYYRERDSCIGGNSNGEYYCHPKSGHEREGGKVVSYGHGSSRPSGQTRPRLDEKRSRGQIMQHLSGSHYNETWSKKRMEDGRSELKRPDFHAKVTSYQSRYMKRDVDRKANDVAVETDQTDVNGILSQQPAARHSLESQGVRRKGSLAADCKPHGRHYSELHNDSVKQSPVVNGKRALMASRTHSDEHNYLENANDLRYSISGKMHKPSRQYGSDGLRSQLLKLKKNHLRARAMASVKKTVKPESADSD